MEEGNPDPPARARGRPSSCEEGKERKDLFPSFLKEGWRPEAARVVRNRKLEDLPSFLKEGGGPEAARGVRNRRLALISGSFVLALVLCALSLSAQAQSKCLVLDPELQASYSGGCKDGKAEGAGVANGSAVYA